MKTKVSHISLAFVALALAVGAPAAAETQKAAEGLEFNHLYMAISVQDIDAVSAFYVEKLGFKLEKEASLGDAVQFRWFTNGTSRVELIRMAGSEAGPARQTPPGHLGVQGFSHLALETPDIVATKAALAAKGVTPIVDISDLPPLGIKAMFIADPEGNPIEIVQRLP
ncbi:MAG TPA: VOC family protein [Croceibacterium sp.]|nr:VOC family protein [Croceibacterium sp.]